MSLRFSVWASGHILIVLVCWFFPIKVEAQCLVNRFRCDSGKCISPHFVCDGDNDCGDGSDEKYCQSFTSYSASCRRPSHVRCLTGDCLVHSEYCSGSAACPNKDDLHAAYSCNCDGDHFKCLRDDKCIPKSMACDGKPACPDGSDEIPAVCASRPCASSAFKCVTNKTCITTDLLCNGRYDCGGSGSGDTSDEEWPACRCNTTLASKVCKCPPGFRIESDSGGFKSCQDIDECSFHNSSLLCNHSCLNTEGGYRCTCSPGYVLMADGKNCESPLFLYQRQGTLVLTKLDFTSVPVEVSSMAMDGYDFDSHSKTVYWTSTSSANGSLLGSRNIDTNKSDADHIHYRDLDSPTLLAFDWVTGNVFVVTHTTDPEPESPPKIMICSVKESKNNSMGMKRKGGCAKICNLQGMDDFPVEVTGLIVAPEYGYIFWAQVIRDNENDPTENRNGSIWRARVDGSRISKLVSEVPNPTGLAMDYMFGLVYWVDSSTRTLESVNFDGSNRTVVTRIGNNNFDSIQGLTVLGDQVTWFDNGNIIQCTISQEKLITSANLTTTNCTSLTNSDLTAARFPKVLHPSLQPKSSDACTESPCSFICVVADIYGTEDSTRDTTTSSRDLDIYGFRCLCPDEFIADDPNSVNCTHHTLTTTTIATTKTTGIPWIPTSPRSATCLGFQFKCTNGRCITREYVCDSDNDCGDFSDEVGCISRTPSTTRAVTRPTPTTTTTTQRPTPRTSTTKVTKATTTVPSTAVTNDSGTKSSNHSNSSKSTKIIIIIIIIILVVFTIVALKRRNSAGNSTGRNLWSDSYFRFQNRS